MRFFLERGGDFQRADAFGVTPLHVAAALDYEEMLQFLLERGGAFMCVYQGSEKFRTVCTISEIKSTKAVTEAVPFQKILMYSLGTNMHLLGLNKVLKYTF